MHPPLGTGEPTRDDALAAAAAEVLEDGRSKLVEAGGVRAFVDAFLPPPALIVCGAGDDARPLVSYAAQVGFRVAVVDHRPAYLTHRRFPDAWRLIEALPEDEAQGLPTGPASYVILKTHNVVRDKAWARRFAAQAPAYLGLLGPRARCEEIAAETGDALDPDRIFGPVGLDVGAEGPEQVGLCIVAELLAVQAGRTPQHLRDRKEAIHVA